MLAASTIKEHSKDVNWSYRFLVTLKYVTQVC